MASLRRILLRLASLVRSRRAEADLSREIQAHLQLIEDEFRASGLSAREARAAARRAFGGVEQTKERQRDERQFRWLDSAWLDARLGARMLSRYPGLTLVGGLGLAVGIAIAAMAFEVVGALRSRDVPLSEGDRIVALQFWDAASNRSDPRRFREFVGSSGQLGSLADVGGFRSLTRNLIVPGFVPEAVTVAEMTASGFRLARVAPLVGRYLFDEDEREGAPLVAVIGYELWQSRFSGDPTAVGRTIQLGPRTHAIVGVMPEGFAFPVNDRIWTALQPAARGADIVAFARLSHGATLERAQAEFRVARQRAAGAAAAPSRTPPRVVPYTYPFLDMDDPDNALALRLMLVVVVLLLVGVSVNVSVLVYARTAMRHTEIAIRSALGASRRRIVGQLFLEALVLASAAAVFGLALAAAGLRQAEAAVLDAVTRLPFWLDIRLSWRAVAAAAALTVLAAAIVGVVPALKATGRGVQQTLQGLSAGAGSGMHLGRLWTLLIVGQVALSVTLLPPAVYQAWEAIRSGTADPGFPAEEFLTARLAMDSTAGAAAGPSRFAAVERDLDTRLEREGAVVGVTFASSAPAEEPTVWIDAEGVALPSPQDAEGSAFAVREGTFGHEARFNRVDGRFFDVFDVPLVAGRRFGPGDVDTVIVNRTFADRILGGSPLGRRIRYVGRSGDARSDLIDYGRWLEVVGVVADFPVNQPPAGGTRARLYHVAAPGSIHPITVAVRLRGTTPAGFTGRLRELAAAADPDLQLRRVFNLDDLMRQEQRMMKLVATGLAVVTLSVVVLSAAGIYALMSVIVTKRRREIGIRAALGADSARILRGIFSRAVAQLTTGAFIGGLGGFWIDRLTSGDLMRGHAAIVLPSVGAFMTLVGLLAALGPARRSLRIDPTESLRES